MPRAVELALKRAGRKKGYMGKRLEDFVYGTMTNMMKKGEIKWDRGKHGK
jgi:hypothetical protein